jgi:hypothetical protein
MSAEVFGSPLRPTPEMQPAPERAPAEEWDQELLALPDPPRAERTWTAALMTLTALVALLMAYALRHDVAYALSPAAAFELGDLAALESPVLPASANSANRLVSASGQVGGAGALRFERPLLGNTFRLMPIAGRTDLWVELTVAEGTRAGRYVPPSTFRGRLVPIEDAGLKHRGLVSALRAELGNALPVGTRLLIQDETPQGTRWALALACMCIAFAAWNLYAVTRLYRRVREEE